MKIQESEKGNFYLCDPAGNVAGITDQDGYLWQSCWYDAFDNAAFRSPQYDNEYTFNGESYNPNIHSQYLRARYYDTVKGSFLTEDSYLSDIRNPLTLNRYSYCIGNPLFYDDPSGHDIKSFVASALIGNKKAIEVKNRLISQGDKWSDGVTQEHQKNQSRFMDDTYEWLGEHTAVKNNTPLRQANNNFTAGIAGSLYTTYDTITSPEYLAARVYNVAAHPLQTLDRINVSGADVLNGVLGIADKIRNKEYASLARGTGYIAGNIAQAYAISKGIEKCGDLINKKRYGTGTFADGMSLEDAKAYLEFQDHGSKAGLTDAELLGVQKVDDALASSLVNADNLLMLHKAEQIKQDNFLIFGNVNGNIEPVKSDFIVTSNGTVMDTSKNYNLIGTGQNGDWFQIHNVGRAEEVGFPHTHVPKLNTDGIHISYNRIVRSTIAEDIDLVDYLLRSGEMILRTKGRR